MEPGKIVRRDEKAVRFAVQKDYTACSGHGRLEEVNPDVSLEHVPTVVKISKISREEGHDTKGNDLYQPKVARRDLEEAAESSVIREVAPRETRRTSLRTGKARRASRDTRPDFGDSPA